MCTCMKSLASVLHMQRTKSSMVAPADGKNSASAKILDNNNLKPEAVEDAEKRLLQKLNSPKPSANGTANGHIGNGHIGNGIARSPAPASNTRNAPISAISDRLGTPMLSDSVPTSAESRPQSNGPRRFTVSPRPSPRPQQHQVLVTSSKGGEAVNGNANDSGVESEEMSPEPVSQATVELEDHLLKSPTLSNKSFTVSRENSAPTPQPKLPSAGRKILQEKRQALTVHEPEEKEKHRSIAEQCRSFESRVSKLERVAGPPSTTKTKAVGPKKVYKGSFKESNNTTSVAAVDKVIFPADLKRLDSPKSALTQALANLNTTNWETNIEGFKLLVRLARFNPEFLHNDLHQINLIGWKHLSNLRSQVARSGCLFFKEMFEKLGKLMEQDVEKISEKLLDKSADTNKFIREDAAAALEAMVNHIPPAKAFASLDPYGTKHKNAVVRSTTSRMTSIAVEKLGAERCLNELGDRILPMLVSFVQEGSLETRMRGKAALAVLAVHPDFDNHLKANITPEALRHVTKCIASIKSEVQGRSY